MLIRLTYLLDLLVLFVANDFKFSNFFCAANGDLLQCCFLLHYVSKMLQHFCYTCLRPNLISPVDRNNNDQELNKQATTHFIILLLFFLVVFVLGLNMLSTVGTNNDNGNIYGQICIQLGKVQSVFCQASKLGSRDVLRSGD